MGSSYAPALVDSLQDDRSMPISRNGRAGQQDLADGQEKVMPTFADNKNVMCYIDDIYVYLQGALRRRDRPRPAAEP